MIGGSFIDCLPSLETMEVVGKNLFILFFFMIVGFLIFNYFSGKNFSHIINCRNCIHTFKKSISTNNLINDSDFIEPIGGFCMSITLNINDFYTNSEVWRHIFHKGSIIDNTNDINYMNFNKNGDNNQYPGLWIHPNTNNFRICLTTSIDENEYFDMFNISLGKWIEISINIQEKICEIYLDGKLNDTFICKNNIKYNKGNAYFLYNNSSPWGEIKNFRYIPDFLNADVFPFMALIDNN